MPITGLIFSATLTLWFGFTFLAEAIYFNDPRHKDEQLKRWMSPRYVVMSYDLPRSVMLEVFNLSAKDLHTRPRMQDIADRMGLSLDELSERVRKAAIAYREANQ